MKLAYSIYFYALTPGLDLRVFVFIPGSELEVRITQLLFFPEIDPMYKKWVYLFLYNVFFE